MARGCVQCRGERSGPVGGSDQASSPSAFWKTQDHIMGSAPNDTTHSCIKTKTNTQKPLRSTIRAPPPFCARPGATSNSRASGHTVWSVRRRVCVCVRGGGQRGAVWLVKAGPASELEPQERPKKAYVLRKYRHERTNTKHVLISNNEMPCCISIKVCT